MTSRDERQLATIAIWSFLWLALLGVGWLAGPVVDWIWTVLVVGASAWVALKLVSKR
jgi:hypothetical protein